MRKILIADDSDNTRIYIRNALLSRGWTVCGEATDGLQAVQMASQLKPDLVILDLSMPVLTGLEAAKEILQAAPGLPIVLFTLHEAPQVREAAARVGVLKVVSKEAGLAPLFTAIEESLRRAEASPLDPVGPLTIPVDPKAEPLVTAAETVAPPGDGGAEAIGPLAAPADQSLNPLAIPPVEAAAPAAAPADPPGQAAAPETPPTAAAPPEPQR
ncbi:MAG TPA: response regulator transcription factor [Candidatus Acidoferrales bacterium]|nr:response regulator transcription factor [Candidatus Acidoferrales bacterium]